MRIHGRTFTRRELEGYTGNMEQVGGTHHVVLTAGRAQGVRAIEFDTGAGLCFTAVPDRGLDIAHCTYRGVNMIYLTPNGITSPAFYEPEGFGWLRTFFGGLLTTCGLTYFGNPGRDGEEELGLHGRYSTSPAERVCDRSRWEGDRFVLEVTGEIGEGILFGEKIWLERSIRTALGEKYLTVRDRVYNRGFSTSPFCMLYHINTGFPLLDRGSELILSSTYIEPYDDNARGGLDDVLRAGSPQHNFQGQDFLHTMAADEGGFALAALVNRALGGGLGLYLRFRTHSLPFLNQWKMLGEGDYVFGIEPVNTIILNRAALRRSGRLPFLEPGETADMEVEIGILEGEEEIEEFSRKVRSITKGRESKHAR
jgi:hypothetical protein